jgi:rare lipoprotein A
MLAGVKRVHGAAALFTLTALGFGGCAQQPQHVAANHSKEYFPSSVYGPASRRVVENGPVPHGGGQYLVGKPYTVAGQTYYPSEKKLVQTGNASWYGDAFHGRLTANGEIYDRDSFTAAHPTMPLPSYARVTNLRNNASMIVRVNDRGPFASNRVMDVSRRVAEALDFKRTGTARIKVEYVGRASLAGSDDAKLYATLRTNGPAPWHEQEPVMTAQGQPAQPMRTAAFERDPEPLPPPVLHAVERKPEPVWHAEAPQPLPPRARYNQPLPVERPVHDEAPVKAAAYANKQPVLHWQQGPEGKPVSSLSWTAPEPFPKPISMTEPKTASAHPPLRPSHQLDLATIPGAGVPIGTHAHSQPPVKLARAHTGD